MKINEFMDRFELTNKKTVLGWLEKGYIPGAFLSDDGEYWIPDAALPPYTKARAKNSDSIFKSMLKGVVKRRYLLPELYKMSKAEFNWYVSTLEKAGLIAVEKIDNIDYYRPTMKTKEYLNDNTKMRALLKQFQPLVESAFAGTTQGIMSYNDTH